MKASRLLASFAALCFCVAAVLCLGSQASAQSTTDGAIGGTVIDSSGAAVPNAKVAAKNSGTNAVSSATTDRALRPHDPRLKLESRPRVVVDAPNQRVVDLIGDTEFGEQAS